MEVKSAKLMSYILGTGLILGFGIFVWNDAFADVGQPVPSPTLPVVNFVSTDKKTDVDVARVIAKTHQNNVGVGHTQTGNPQINAAPVGGNSNNAGEDSASAKDLGIHSMVAPHAEDSGVIQAKTSDVPLSTGAACTVDPHGDNLIHLSTGSHDKGASEGEHGHVDMTVHEVKQVLDNVVNTADAVEAKVVSVGKDGEATLHAVTQTNTPPTNTVVIAQPIVVTPTTITQTPPAAVTTPINNPAPPTVIPPVVAPVPAVTQTPAVVTTPVSSPVTPEETAPTAVVPPVTAPVNNPVTVTNTPPTIILPVNNPVITSTVTPPVVTPAPTVTQTPAVVTTPVNNPVAPTVTPAPAVTPTTIQTPIITAPVESITNPITPNTTDATTNTAIVSHPENIALDTSNVEADATISGISNPSATVGNNVLITVGQVVQKTGNVIEMDSNGNGHSLDVGDNVHLGGKFVFNGMGNLKIKSFTGEIINVGE